MTTSIADLVSSHPLLAGLPGDATTTVAGCARNVAVEAGELLLAENDPADTLYLVRRGQVAIEVHAPGHGPVLIETVGPGEAVGWSWLFPPYRWHFDARALEPVGVVAVDAVCLRAKAEADPRLGYELMQRVAGVLLDRLQMTRLRLLDLYGGGGGA
ncbi:MAG TPA: cyclic nucleotide-binding domain-containing protein [Acidimicrobiales bacterium]|nr:cyclic nucleotide-binding domain-containing protein [Acidimicrobiales bacterium]